MEQIRNFTWGLIQDIFTSEISEKQDRIIENMERGEIGLENLNENQKEMPLRLLTQTNDNFKEKEVLKQEKNKQKRKRKQKCYICKRKGHISTECKE